MAIRINICWREREMLKTQVAAKVSLGSNSVVSVSFSSFHIRLFHHVFPAVLDIESATGGSDALSLEVVGC